MKKIVIAMVFFLISYILYVTMFEQTPYRIISNIYGIEIPKQIEVSEHDEYWTFLGNGYNYIRFENIDSIKLEIIANQCRKQSFSSLPIPEGKRFCLPKHECPNINASKGYYYFKRDSNSRYVFILDFFNKKIYAYYQIN